jgi:hypothetical protein
MQISKKIMKRKAELKLNISDIFNQRQIFYQNMDANLAFNESTDRIINDVKFGTTISIGFSYNLPLL